MQEQFINVVRRQMEWLECSALSREPWLRHAFTTRRSNASLAPARDFNLSQPRAAPPSGLSKEWQVLLAAFGGDASCLAVLRQIHSDRVYRVFRKNGAPSLYFRSPDGLCESFPAPCGDALVTREPKAILAVLTADCLPVLLADSRRRTVAAVHAGWRGALAGIVEKAVGEMKRAFGSKPADLLAAIGPSIRSCCYEVGDEVVAAFRERYEKANQLFRWDHAPGHGRGLGGKPAAHLDLIAVAERQLSRAGVLHSHIHAANLCTACRTDLLYSYRREGAAAGRTAAFIEILP